MPAHQVLEYLNHGWVGTVIGLLSIIVALIIYRASRRLPAPRYQIKTTRLVGHTDKQLPEQVTVTAFGQPVEKLTKAAVIFWNAGTKTLDGRDVVLSDPLRIVASEGSSVLDAIVVSSTRPVIAARTQIDSTKSNTAIITFDFLDAADGFAVEVLIAGETRAPQLAGTIKGLPSGPRQLRTRSVRQRMPTLLTRSKFRIILLFQLLFGAFLASVPWLFAHGYSALVTGIVRAMGVLFMLSCVGSMAFERRKFPAQLHHSLEEPRL